MIFLDFSASYISLDFIPNAADRQCIKFAFFPFYHAFWHFSTCPFSKKGQKRGNTKMIQYFPSEADAPEGFLYDAFLISTASILSDSPTVPRVATPSAFVHWVHPVPWIWARHSKSPFKQRHSKRRLSPLVPMTVF